MKKIINFVNSIKKIFIFTKIYVFLNNKLISLDTILPIIFILKNANKNIKITYYVFNIKTYNLIKKNIILMKAINQTGNLYYFHTKSSNTMIRFYQKINSAKILFIILISSFFCKSTYIHFKALNKWPFKLLYTFNSRRTLYWSSKSLIKPKTIALLDDLAFINEKKNKLVWSFDMKYKYNSATAFVSANKNWPALEFAGNKNVYLYDDLNINTSWVKFLLSNSNNLLNNKLNKPNQNLYVIVGGGGFGGESGIIPYIVDLDKGLWKVLEDIITTIDKIDNSLIYYKPHPNINDKLKKQMEEKFKDYNMIFGDLHPVTLCSYAKCFLVTHWSNTLKIPHKLGIPTIEYTNYNEDALKITNYNSAVPNTVTHFIQNDKNKLFEVLKKIDTSEVKLKIPLEMQSKEIPDIINKIINNGPY
jgi:hypothetical protein